MAEAEGLWFAGAARRCTTDDKRTPPHAVRDSGSPVLLVASDGSGLRRVEVAKGVEGKRERLNHVCFSGDGEWLLFTANLGGVTAEPIGLPNQFQPYGGREDEDEIMVKKGF
ncbi:hypothetical protein DEO72_LG3g1324 [Vigna unguiculata]|uniref:Uncharacterized protein n=1 Tax=Vigna unguiculata TaxID=3917 RepID=A0A4D6LE60_VIGUN|nr:hypothetical protein DEO72_LG3g1324 [Vigna unguiculata]